MYNVYTNYAYLFIDTSINISRRENFKAQFCLMKIKYLYAYALALNTPEYLILIH